MRFWLLPFGLDLCSIPLPLSRPANKAADLSAVETTNRPTFASTIKATHKPTVAAANWATLTTTHKSAIESADLSTD